MKTFIILLRVWVARNWYGNGRWPTIRVVVQRQDGVETIEYLGLASVVVILVGAVALYLSGAGQVFIDLIAELIAAIIDSLQRGW